MKKRAIRYIKISFCIAVIALVAFSQVSIVYAKTIIINQLPRYLAHPNVRAFLDTIAYAEGTLNVDGYKTLYTYKLFSSFDDHPRQRIYGEHQGRTLCSTAAGRYQFLQPIWDKVAARIGAKNFTPINQDLAAIYLLAERGALLSILGNDFDSAVAQSGSVWSSFPGAGRGQPEKNKKELARIYETQLNYYLKKENSALLKEKYSKYIQGKRP